MNGRVDLGDGSGTCGACHGSGDSAWPITNAHPSHQSPTSASPIACATCHAVPTNIHDPGHLDGIVRVAFSGHALDRASLPTWDGRACNAVACHGNGLIDGPASPQWTNTSGTERACNACHGLPPMQHTSSIDCGRSDCHGSEVGRTPENVPFITPSGKALHVNGVVDLRTP
jgi:predicted CxxxxCH...CXXCH cytochrome family protein